MFIVSLNKNARLFFDDHTFMNVFNIINLYQMNHLMLFK